MAVILPILLIITGSNQAKAFTCPRNGLVNGVPSLSERVRLDSTTRRFNFFKDLVDAAFENDRSLSKDKTKGQYDAPGEEFEDNTGQYAALTETQQKWREKQFRNDITPEMVAGTSWTLDLYLSGVPERDPSNDLYGSKVNISSRDRQTGLSLPSSPSATITVDFLENGICRSSESGFTSGEKDGEWKLSEDGKILRFSFDSLGYTRTVETKGSIQKVYWTDEEEKRIKTSSSYSIPPGWVYGDVELSVGRQPGTFELGNSGVLRIEQASGLFGISSTMSSCGKFEARRNVSS
eukprot:scaffold1697_cov120-Cylindrotheca_fusiformis.AAC.33